MIKRKTIMILFTTILLTQVLILQPTTSNSILNKDTNSSIQSVQKPITGSLQKDAPGGTEIIKDNVMQYSDFEVADSDGGSLAFYEWGTGYGVANHSYQDEVISGSYGAYYSTRGTDQYSSYFSRSRYLGYKSQRAYLNEDINMNFKYNAKANPNFAQGAEILIYIRFNSNLGNYYLYYYLSRVSGLPTNGTTNGYYDIRGSLNTWYTVSRNLTEDFTEVFSGPDLSQTYPIYHYFIITSPKNPSGDTILLFDDVSYTNETSFEYVLDLNGDFESGDSMYWNDYSTGPGSVYLTEADKTQGQKAMNMTIYMPNSDSESNIYADRDIYWSGWGDIPKGFYAEQIGDVVFNYDWKYSDTPGIGNQYAYFYITASNGTYDISIMFYLGDESDVISNSNSTYTTWAAYYIEANGFGIRDTWHNFHIDFNELLINLGYSSAFSVWYTGYYLYGYGVEDSTAQLLVDDYQLITNPVGDSSFEGEFFYSASDPILFWQTPSNPYYVNITTDVHSGNYAANLTSGSGINHAYCRRNMYMHIENNQFTDFWWRLDKITNTGTSAYSTIELEVNNFQHIYYVLGNNSYYNPSNSSNYCYYYVEGNNVIGIWQNLFRNLTNDVFTAFGPGNHNITQIEANSYTAGVEEVITIVDDLNFVRDAQGPIISNIELNPSMPQYGQTVDVSVDVTDNILLRWVQLFYKIGAGSWQPTQMNFLSGKYRATIPSADYGTVISYYFVATDIYYLVTPLGSAGAPYTYTVDDYIDPILFVEAPPESQVLNETIIFNITEAYDPGSGIDFFEIEHNGSIVYHDSVVPANFIWDTTIYENMEYDVFFRLFDNAGNSVEIVLHYTVYNPPTGWETFKAFMQKWYPYITAGAGALLIGILVIVIVVRRKKRLA